MILPHTHAVTLLLILAAVVCFGSWANTFKMAGGWRYELYYIDWALGVALAAIILALTAGSLGFDGFSVADEMLIAGKRQWLYGFVAGGIFNLGNLLLMAALSLAGMSIAFPMVYAVSLITGAVLGYVLGAQANGGFLVVGCAILAGAAVAGARAYREFLVARHEELAKAGKAKSTRRPSAARGNALAIAGGGMLGLYLPLLDKARQGEIGLQPYALALTFAAGVLFSTFLLDLFFMNLPVDGEPLDVMHYIRGSLKCHLLGVLGGVLWCAGLLAALVAAAVPAPIQAGAATAGAVAPLGALLAAFWGMAAWKELRGAGAAARMPAILMLALFAAGFVLLLLART